MFTENVIRLPARPSSELPRSFDDLLARITARLVVALHAERTDCLHAAKCAERIVERRRDRLDVPFRTVQNRARREEPRRDASRPPASSPT